MTKKMLEQSRRGFKVVREPSDIAGKQRLAACVSGFTRTGAPAGAAGGRPLTLVSNERNNNLSDADSRWRASAESTPAELYAPSR